MTGNEGVPEVRTVYVKCTWTSMHEICVPRDHARIDEGDLDTVLEVGDDDVTPQFADLIDWEVRDRG